MGRWEGYGHIRNTLISKKRKREKDGRNQSGVKLQLHCPSKAIKPWADLHTQFQGPVSSLCPICSSILFSCEKSYICFLPIYIFRFRFAESLPCEKKMMCAVILHLTDYENSCFKQRGALHRRRWIIVEIALPRTFSSPTVISYRERARPAF